jgi:hypothetical protein
VSPYKVGDDAPTKRSTPPNITHFDPSKAIALAVLAAGVVELCVASVQNAPFHVQVSRRTLDASSPPKTTIAPAPAAIA